MKKTTLQRITSLALTVLMVLGMVSASTVQTHAASGKWQLMMSDDLYAGNPSSYAVQVVKWKSNGEPVFATTLKAASSNPKVLKVKKEKWGDETVFSYSCKKVGKAKLTVKYKTPDGKTKTLTKTVKVKECPITIKNLSVNGKKIKINKKTKFRYEDYNYKKKTAKIKLAPTNGWKIKYVSATAYNWDTGKTKNIKVSKSTFTKGKQVKIPSGYKWVDFNITMCKGQKFFNYYVGLGRMD